MAGEDDATVKLGADASDLVAAFDQAAMASLKATDAIDKQFTALGSDLDAGFTKSLQRMEAAGDKAFDKRLKPSIKQLGDDLDTVGRRGAKSIGDLTQSAQQFGSALEKLGKGDVVGGVGSLAAATKNLTEGAGGLKDARKALEGVETGLSKYIGGAGSATAATGKLSGSVAGMSAGMAAASAGALAGLAVSLYKLQDAYFDLREEQDLLAEAQSRAANPATERQTKVLVDLSKQLGMTVAEVQGLKTATGAEGLAAVFELAKDKGSKYAVALQTVTDVHVAATKAAEAQRLEEEKLAKNLSEQGDIMKHLQEMNEQLNKDREAKKDPLANPAYSRDESGKITLTPSLDKVDGGLNIVGMNDALRVQNELLEEAKKLWAEQDSAAQMTASNIGIGAEQSAVALEDVAARALAASDAMIAKQQAVMDAYKDLQVQINIGGGRSATVDQDMLNQLAEKARKGMRGGVSNNFTDAFAKMMEKGDIEGMKDLLKAIRGQQGGVQGMIGQGGAAAQLRETEMILQKLFRTVLKEEERLAKGSEGEKRAAELERQRLEELDIARENRGTLQFIADRLAEERDIELSVAIDGRELAASVTRQLERNEGRRT